MTGPPSGAAQRRVLVADGAAENRSAVRHGLGGSGLTLDDVADGRSALSVLRTTRVDVLLLAATLARCDGVAVLDAMQADPTIAPPQVVVLGGPDDASSVLRCLEMGADDVLWTPVDPTALRARVTAGLLRVWRREREQECREQVSLLADALADEGGGTRAGRTAGCAAPFERLDGLLARAAEQARRREDHLRRATARA